MRVVLRHAAAPEIHPAELDGTEAGVASGSRPSLCLVGVFAEQLRGVGQLVSSGLVSEQVVDGLAAPFAERVPQRDLDPRKGVGRLQKVHAVEA